jgi:sRNA-binding regulator protein Hfq
MAMANSSHLPSGNLRELRPAPSQDHVDARLRAVAPALSALNNVEEVELPSIELPSLDQAGPRKLVRPKLPPGMQRKRVFGAREESPILAHQAPALSHSADAGSHAETFYFQKQVQMQTLMVFVLEDGERVEGYIEWYDRDVIKVRNGKRALIYKSAIKYLYKAGEVPTLVDGYAKAR